MSSSSSKSSQARLREALTGGVGGPSTKGPPVFDGVLSVTPDTAEAIEWRNRKSVVDTIAACSPILDDDDEGPQTSELYGKFTWKIEQFGENGKRELRSSVFEVGSFKWYLLVYPHGCDVANHLSLFLCVADYDKLLPGWSQFAQFTIAVVNRDPKKSKFSDTLHRFCKKEHDWGWKKFMELGKVLDGFTVADSLIIKAQVQVIRDRPQRPFKCLDAQYRRELVRVYLANVEGIARRFVDEKREYLQRLLEDGSGFKQFWRRLGPARQHQLASEQAPLILKGVIKRFFNEKEVTSTLVVDALYCGVKLLEGAGRQRLEEEASSSSSNGLAEPCGVLIDAKRGVFFFAGDAISVLERAAADAVPTIQSDKQQGELPLRMAQEADECSRDAVERDERRLADLGRRCVEMFAAAHIADTRMEAAHQEAEVLKRQEALLIEEEQRQHEEQERQAARAEADRERRAKKKERTKRKKEVERLKREAEEAERQQQEEQRRLEQQRKQQEADERRRREEAEREEELQRQRAAAKQAAEAKRQQQEAARRAKQQQAAVAAAAARQQQRELDAAAEAERQAASGGHQGPAVAAPAATATTAEAGCSRSCSSCCEDESTASGPVPLSAEPSDSTDGGSGSLAAATGASSLASGCASRGTLTPPSTAASSSATPEAGSLAGAAVAPAMAAAASGRDRGGSGGGGGSEVAPADALLPTEEGSLVSTSDGCSELSVEDDVEALRRQLALTQATLAVKDAELAAMRARVDELEAQLAAAAGAGTSGELSGAGTGMLKSAPASQAGSGLLGSTPATTSAPVSRPASAASDASQHRRSLSCDRPVTPAGEAAAGPADGKLNGRANGIEGLPAHAASAAAAAGHSGLTGHTGSGPSPATAGLSASGSSGRPPAPQQQPQRPAQQQQLSVAAMLRQQGSSAVPPAAAGSVGARHASGLASMNPAAQQFNPGGHSAHSSSSSSGSFGVSKQPGMAGSGSTKRTGYAAAAAGEQAGPPPAVANGTSTYRSAVARSSMAAAAAMGPLSMGNGGSSGPPPPPPPRGAPSNGSSGRSSADGIGGLLPNGSCSSSGIRSNGSSDGLYGAAHCRPPPVVLPQEQTGAARAFSSPLPGSSKRPLDLQTAAAALESPGFDDFAHMGLISDLLE